MFSRPDIQNMGCNGMASGIQKAQVYWLPRILKLGGRLLHLKWGFLGSKLALWGPYQATTLHSKKIWVHRNTYLYMYTDQDLG